MSRIRTIKPEFPDSESIGRISRDARLLFIELWTFADDSGTGRGSSRLLASTLFPYDDDAFGLIDGWLAELERERMIVRYSVDGARYVHILNFLKHQKIDKPTRSRLPGPPGILANPRESIAEPSLKIVQDLVPSTCTKDLVPSTRAGEVELSPEMITRAVMVELQIAGRDLAVVLDQVVSAAMKAGEVPERIGEQMIAAWLEYGRAGPSLKYTVSAGKFFGEGHWRNKDAWPWKEAKQPQGKGRVYANAK